LFSDATKRGTNAPDSRTRAPAQQPKLGNLSVLELTEAPLIEQSNQRFLVKIKIWREIVLLRPGFEIGFVVLS
jgi:hypothetical protein